MPRQRNLKGDGRCACGCGRVPTRYTQQHVPDGIVPGDFRLFVAGHHRRRPGDPRNSGPDYVEQDCGYTTPCHVWQRSRFKSGYGQIGRGRRAHVVFWERRFGPVPPGKQLDHLCCVIECVNPDHMEPVTALVNVRRSRATKLTQDQVDEIRSRAVVETQRSLANEFGVTAPQVSRIVNFRRWRERV